MANTYCPYYHIDCNDETDINQCWAIVERTHVTTNIIHCGCDGDEKRCDFEKIGGKADERL